ncbi:hypothetical protein BT69DRAFT_1321249 [Atractiella rhizophila]|nr:hypothetical protein BT69DRAFT_1321249 [Atractiella rhizophila]
MDLGESSRTGIVQAEAVAVLCQALKEEATVLQEGQRGRVKLEQRNTGNQTTRPVTIACLIKAEQPHPDAEFSIHGKELNSVTFVGIVRIAMDGSTHRSFTIEDGTGQIDLWPYNLYLKGRWVPQS